MLDSTKILTRLYSGNTTLECKVSKPARSMPRLASGFFMNISQTNPLRAFSAMTMVIPVSIPITSVSYHFLSGLNAFTKP